MDDHALSAMLEAELRARCDSVPPSLAKATWQLLLGETAESIETLAAAHAATPPDTDPAARPAALALLAGDRDAARRHAVHALSTPATWVRGWREFHLAMLALAAGDDEAARGYVQALEAYARGHDRLPSGPPGTVSELARGILDADVARADAGLRTLLDWHVRSARSRTSERFNSANGAICLDAILALLVAHGRSVAVPVDAKFRRAKLPALAVHLTEWAGEPIPRLLELSFETDLVAGAWLAQRGLEMAQPAQTGPTPEARTTKRRSAMPADDVEASVVRDFLRRHVEQELGSQWQLMSWSLMIGDPVRARRHLDRALADARRAWEQSRPASGGILRRLLRSQEVPNPNLVRAHFGLALAAGDERAIREAGEQLRAWMDAVQEDERRQSRSIHPPYEHVQGCLDYIADMLGPAGPRAPADHVSPVVRHLHAACVGLERGDTAIVQQALQATLEAHAAQLERRMSPPAPVSLEAIQIAASARRRGLAVAADEAFAAYPVPIVVRDAPGDRGRVGRLPADLMGRPLFG